MKSIKLALTAGLLATTALPVSAGKADDTLNWATAKEVAVVDPYFSVTRELVIMGHMGWDGLVLFNNETGEFDPLLATSWNWISNTVVEFDLREDVVFHDGSTFDADDVVYTINFLADEANGVPAQSVVNWMKGATKLDQYKVRLELVQPFPNAFAYLANEIMIMPEGYYESSSIGAAGTRDLSTVSPIGTGPYKVSDVRTGKFVNWAKNETYFADGPKGTPQIGNINFRTIGESNTQLAELMTGGLDWAWDVPKEQALRLEESGRVQVVNEKTLRISYLAFDVDGSSGQEFFTDQKVRAAVAHAINREAIAKRSRRNWSDRRPSPSIRHAIRRNSAARMTCLIMTTILKRLRCYWLKPDTRTVSSSTCMAIVNVSSPKQLSAIWQLSAFRRNSIGCNTARCSKRSRKAKHRSIT